MCGKGRGERRDRGRMRVMSGCLAGLCVVVLCPPYPSIVPPSLVASRSLKTPRFLSSLARSPQTIYRFGRPPRVFALKAADGRREGKKEGASLLLHFPIPKRVASPSSRSTRRAERRARLSRPNPPTERMGCLLFLPRIRCLRHISPRRGVD